jgi:hypothetical protein
MIPIPGLGQAIGSFVGGKLLGGLFGGGGGPSPQEQATLARLQMLYDHQMNQYNLTNLEQMDAQTVASLRRSIERGANTMLRAQDSGRDPNKFDTEVTRQKALVAENASADVARAEADLATTRPQRKRALLPDASLLTTAAGIGSQIQARNDAQSAAIAQAAGPLGSAFGDWIGGALKPPSSSVASSATSATSPYNVLTRPIKFAPTAKQGGKYSIAIPTMGIS